MSLIVILFSICVAMEIW